MVAATEKTERDYLIKLAEDYRRKGYNVKFQPDSGSLPESLRGYRPDMLASGGNESVVVEVKSRPLIKGDADYLSSLAKSVESTPGWRFELVVLASGEDEDEFDLGQFPEDRESLTVNDIVSGLEFAKQWTASQSESTLLYTWSLVEAILRLLAKHEDVGLRTFDPVHMIKKLVLEGVISRSDYQTLLDILPLRNAIAHGFKSNQVDAHAVNSLMDVSERLLLLLGSTEAEFEKN